MATPRVDPDHSIHTLRYRVTKRRVNRRDLFFTGFLVLIMAGLIGFAVVNYLRSQDQAQSAWVNPMLAAPEPEMAGENGKFRMGGISMGATPRDVRRTYPEVFPARDTNGRRVAVFQSDNAVYRLTFLEPAQGSRVYRMEYNRTFNALDHDAVLERIAQSFGRPSVGDCGRSMAAGGALCRYTWWLRDGNRLDASIRSRRGDGRVDTVVRLTAVNAYLAELGKPLNRTPGTSFDLPKETEALPFD